MFADIGSGCGRLVLAQALTWPWKSCRGVEKVSSLHDMGEAAVQAARQMSVEDGPATEGMETISSEALQVLRTMAPCKLSLGDVNDEVCACVCVFLSHAFAYQSRFDMQRSCKRRACHLPYLVRDTKPAFATYLVQQYYIRSVVTAPQ